ncbi:MAG: sigma-70 family RNA polymerase sigma factor [Myxococcales bacterium]|nr:sigma-70 family RNA polymerase sigma factor [Myxococcales bacterium]
MIAVRDVSDEGRVVEQHRGFVEAIARKLMAELDLATELDDLVAYGLSGLLEAHRRFDPSRNVQFRTFAYYRIRGAIIDGVRQMARLPAHVHARRRIAESATTVLEEAAQTRAAAPPGARGIEETAAALDATLGRLTAAYVLSALGQDDEATRSRQPDDLVAEREAARRLHDAVGRLDPRERALVEGFYFHDRHFDDVARELGISKSWASRIHARALTKLREALEGTPATSDATLASTAR